MSRSTEQSADAVRKVIFSLCNFVLQPSFYKKRKYSLVKTKKVRRNYGLRGAYLKIF